MDTKECFRILGIDRTKDEGKITEAYRNLLTSVNPEDDAEGFMRLREAYETARRYARTPDDEEAVQEATWLGDGETGAFMKRVMEVYTAMPRRLDAGEWKALAQDPVLDSLEEGEDAKWKLFQYLADNYRLPCRIWRVLDEAFFIEERQQEFKEHLPENFVDYILFKIHDEKEESEFPYEEFKGAPDAEYDEFLERLIGVMNDDGEEETQEQRCRKTGTQLDQLASFGIWHPWYELERVKYLMMAEEKEEAEELIRNLLEKYENDEKVNLTGADLLWKLGDTAEAKRLYNVYLERERISEKGRYIALYNLGKLAADEKDWKTARKYAVDARRIWQTEEVGSLIKEAGEALIGLYTSRADALTMEEARILGWCFYDMQRMEEGLAFLTEHSEYAEDTTEYHKLLTFLYAGSRQAQEILKEADLWRAHMEKETLEDNQLQFANSYYMEGFAYRVLFLENKDEEALAEKYYTQALEAFDKALEVKPEQSEFRIEKISLLREREEYQTVVDECQKLLDGNPNQFAALYYMQEAYQKLRMAQAVIDTFYRAKEVYAGEPEIYLRALNVFMAYNQYQDALGILQQAEEAGVDGYHPLLVEKISVLDQLAESDEEWLSADAFAEHAIEKMAEEQADSKLLADAYLNRAYLNENGMRWDKGRLDKAKEYAELSLEHRDGVDAHYFLGRLYEKYYKDAKNAYPHLKACEEQGMQFEWLSFYIARCHESFKEWDKAIEYYKKQAEENPDSNEAYWRIAWLYRAKFRRTEQLEYAELALQYIDIHEEKHGENAENHRWRAMLYRNLGNMQKALEEIDKSIEMEEDSGRWLIRAQIMKKLHRYEETIVSCQNSIDAEDRYGQDNQNCYSYIFQSYLKSKRLEEGIAYFEKVLEGKLTDEIRDACMEHLSDLEGQAGHCERALYWQEKRFGSIALGERSCDSWEKEALRLEDVLNTWQQFQPEPEEAFYEMLQNATALAEEAYRDENGALEDRAHVCHNLGERYYYAGEFEQAYVWLDRALQLVTGYEQTGSGEYSCMEALWCSLTQITYWLGEDEKNQIYGAKYRKKLEKTYEECRELGKSMEELMTSPGVSRNKMYSLFNYAFFTKQYELAEHYVNLMDSRDMCYWCDEAECSDLWEMKGFIAFGAGKYEEALKCFRVAAKCSWLGVNKDAVIMLRRLEKGDAR